MHGTSPERDERSLLESGELSGDGDDDIAPSGVERLRLEGLANQLDLGARDLFLQGATHLGSGDVAGRDLFNFNQTTYINTHAKPRPLVFGQVDDSELDRLAETYYRPAEFDRLRNGLLNNRVQVLRGRQGTGRTTTALLVLRTLNRRVHSLEPPEEPSSLIESLKDAFAYVMEVPDDSVGASGYLTGAMLYAIRQKLQRIDAYLVIIADNVVIEGPALLGFILPWTSPPHKAVLQHLVVLARTSGIRELFNDQKLRSAIEKEACQASGPGAIANLVRELEVAVSQGQTAKQIIDGLQSQLYAKVTQWLLGEPAVSPATGELSEPTSAALMPSPHIRTRVS